MKDNSMKVYKVLVRYKEDCKQAQFAILIAADSESEAIRVAREKAKLTNEFSCHVDWQNVDWDYEPIDESVEVLGIEEFDRAIVNEPDILSMIFVGSKDDYLQRVGNWKETIQALVYNEAGYARFRRMYIDVPWSEEKIIVYYESYYNNPDNRIIAGLQSRGVAPWGV